MAEEISITRGDEQDAGKLTTLSITTFMEAFGAANRKEDMDKYLTEAMNINRITEELRDESNTFFLARCDGELAGYAKMGTHQKPEVAGFVKPIELERIYVLRKYYSRKIGAKLMSQCMAHAVNNQYKTIWLGVWQHNHRAVAFYKQWGFEFYGTHQFALGDDIQTDELMKKLL